MELLLETKCYVIDKHPYYRIHLKRKQSDLLDLQPGDKLRVQVLEIIRKEGAETKRYQVKLVEVIA